MVVDTKAKVVPIEHRKRCDWCDRSDQQTWMVEFTENDTVALLHVWCVTEWRRRFGDIMAKD